MRRLLLFQTIICITLAILGPGEIVEHNGWTTLMFTPAETTIHVGYGHDSLAIALIRKRDIIPSAIIIRYKRLGWDIQKRVAPRFAETWTCSCGHLNHNAHDILEFVRCRRCKKLTLNRL